MGKPFLRSRRRGAALLALACALSLPGAVPPAEASSAPVRPLDQPQPPPGPRPDAATLAAWQDRRFGMFIHFGLYSVAGGMWHGQRVDHGYSEQIVANAPLPPEQYAALARQFDPVRFDPDAIVALAKAAGMKFIVVTAKHHDGFNLFRTAETSYNAVDGTPYGKDIVRQLAEACARGGLKFGVYYSTIDWHHPGGNTYVDGNSNPITPAQEAFNVAQLKELLGHYGPIAEIWFDMGKPTPAQSAHFADTVHALQPQTMVSGRVWNHQGDFAVMGDNGEPDVALELPWQAPASIFPDTWGYRSWEPRTDLPGKIRENIDRLARVASRGGNYILNIGPEGDGSVVPYEAEVLRGIGRWMRRNGEAIYATRAQPFGKLDFGYATVGRHTLYLFVAKPPADGLLRLPGLVDTRLGRAYRLGGAATGTVPGQERDGVTIALAGLLPGAPAEGSDSADFMPVIAVPFEGELHVRPAAVAAAADGHVALPAARAERYLNYNGYGYEDPSTLYKLAWHAQAEAPAYRLRLDYVPAARAQRLDLVADGRRYPLVLPAAAAGAQAASLDVSVRRDRRAQPYAMSVELTPPEPFIQGTALPVAVRAVELTPLR